MLKCDDDVIGRNTASMHRGFRPEEGFLCGMRAMTANRLYYLRSLKYKESLVLKNYLVNVHCVYQLCTVIQMFGISNNGVTFGDFFCTGLFFASRIV
jgi:hypothetical protein